MGVSVSSPVLSPKFVLLETITVTGATHNSAALPVYSRYYVEMQNIGACRIRLNNDAGANYTYRNLTATAVNSTAGAAYVPVTGQGSLSNMTISGKVPTGGGSITGVVHCGSGAGTAGTDFTWTAAAETQVSVINFTNLTVQAYNFIRIYGVNA